MAGRLVAVAIATGGGLLAYLVSSIVLSPIVMPLAQAFPGLPIGGVWIPLLIGGALAAYVLPAGWHYAAPLVGLFIGVATVMLMPSGPIYLPKLGVEVQANDPGLRQLVEPVLVTTIGGYLCHAWRSRRQKSQ